MTDSLGDVINTEKIREFWYENIFDKLSKVIGHRIVE